jgi:hypothetical protein
MVLLVGEGGGVAAGLAGASGGEEGSAVASGAGLGSGLLQLAKAKAAMIGRAVRSDFVVKFMGGNFTAVARLSIP